MAKEGKCNRDEDEADDENAHRGLEKVGPDELSELSMVMKLFDQLPADQTAFSCTYPSYFIWISQQSGEFVRLFPKDQAIMYQDSVDTTLTPDEG
ncbi:hypothetical protein SLS56_005592 [Neofusicoccum ribis]|uniref:Uncharacterized protein n=1 Tax=Neofusicoccum ribis TaxID=45134 RepID=A0ABR3ST97_9PEZI